jgi:hypothetical protein
MNVDMKQSDGYYPVGPNIITWEVSGNSNCKSDIIWVKLDIVWWE